MNIDEQAAFWKPDMIAEHCFTRELLLIREVREATYVLDPRVKDPHAYLLASPPMALVSHCIDDRPDHDVPLSLLLPVHPLIALAWCAP